MRRKKKEKKRASELTPTACNKLISEILNEKVRAFELIKITYDIITSEAQDGERKKAGGYFYFNVMIVLGHG